MLLFPETVPGTAFHLGEVLVAEERIKVPARAIDGYDPIVGGDLDHAMAMAVLDATITAKHELHHVAELLKIGFLHQE